MNVLFDFRFVCDIAARTPGQHKFERTYGKQVQRAKVVWAIVGVYEGMFLGTYAHVSVVLQMHMCK